MQASNGTRLVIYAGPNQNVSGQLEAVDHIIITCKHCGIRNKVYIS